MCMPRGGGVGEAEKSRSKKALGNSAPVPGIHTKNTRMFHSMPSPPNVWLWSSFLLCRGSAMFGLGSKCQI